MKNIPGHKPTLLAVRSRWVDGLSPITYNQKKEILIQEIGQDNKIHKQN